MHDDHNGGTTRNDRVWTLLTVAVIAVVVVGLGALYLRANTGPGAHSGAAPLPAMFDGAPATLDDAKAKAGEGGLVFAFATADWCAPCQHFKRTTLVDPAVEAWVRAHATPVYVDVDQNPQDTTTLGVRGIPHTALLRADGTVVRTFVGVVPAEELLRSLRDAVGE